MKVKIDKKFECFEGYNTGKALTPVVFGRKK